MTTALADILAVDAASRTMGVEFISGDTAHTRLRQHLRPHLADHRGRCTLASVGVLLDSALGSTAYAASDGRTNFVVASLSIAMANPMPTSGPVIAIGSTVHFEPATGTALGSGQMLDDSGKPLALIHCRSAAVDRVRMVDPAASPSAPTARGDRSTTTFPRSAASSSGIEVLRTMMTTEGNLGPYSRFLGLSISRAQVGSVAGTWMPHSWTLNGLGSVQGGVILSCAATVVELSAQTLTEMGEQYALSDMQIDLVQSPTPAGGPLTFHTQVVRKGRRLANIDFSLTDGANRLIAQARGTAVFSRVHSALRDA
jgi:uncharacterized protein (TIGR00369 family)